MLRFNNQKILISGAGIAGLALATRFEQLGIPYRLIDKKSHLSSEGAGIALPPNALKALRYLNLYEPVMAKAHRVEKIVYAKPSGKILSQASLLESPLDSEAFVALPRHQLHDMLQKGIKNQIHLNSTIHKIKEVEEGVEVEFNSPTLSQEKFSMVVGAEGLHSKVREFAFGKVPLIEWGVSTWRWVCRYPHHGLQPIYMLGAQDCLMAYPIGEDELYCYTHIYDPQDKFLKEGNDYQPLLRKYFARYGGIARQLLPFIPQTENIIPGRLRSVPFPFFTKGRVVLVGDAGSACSPLLQQGAACALEDVIVLAEMLTHFHIEEALSHYKTYREDRVNWIVKASDKPIKILPTMNSAFKLFARDLLIRWKGPLNIQGWKALLSTDPLAELSAFIEKKKS